jgi:hypothetical protein
MNDEISGPSLGSGARSLVLDGLRPIGCRTTGSGVGIAGDDAGGSMLASGAAHGNALAGGARPIATMKPRAVADAIDIDAARRNNGMAHLSPGARRRIDVRSWLM